MSVQRTRWIAGLVSLVLLLPNAPASMAQPDCLGDQEPNDAPEVALSLEATGCIEGTLPDGDQDLAVWEVRPGDVRTRWTLSVDGQPGLLTALKVFAISSDPGAASMQIERSPLWEVARQPGDDEPAVSVDVLLPVGRYLLGISRSALQGGEGDAAPVYRYRIERGTPLPSVVDVEPNDDAGSGAPVSDAFSLAGDLDGSADFVAWQVPATDEHWALELQVPLGEQAALALIDPEGRVIDDVRSKTSAVSFDLALAPGAYAIEVSPRASGPTPYVLTASRAPPEGDPEPNDDSSTAVPIVAGQPQLGRLAGLGDVDRFALDVPAGPPILRDVRAIWDAGSDRTLCLVDAEDRDVVCERGTAGVSMTELGLAPGRHLFEMRGPDDAGAPYLLRLDPTSERPLDFESEPNGSVAYATSLDPVLDMRGRGDDGDTDVFRLQVDGEPQLWQVDLAGRPGSRLEWITVDGRAIDRGESGSGDAVARLTDLYLVPGEHWFRVSKAIGDYRLEATPLGPPRPDAEREANGERVLANRYSIGARRTGRLAVTQDVDFYRFSLAAPQHIALQLEQPPDARTRLLLQHGSEPIGDISKHPDGETLRYDLFLQPGDYFIELRPEQASEGIYTLTSERLDPFRLAVDQEPNDGAATAQPVPSTLEWTGDGVDADDQDWFRIPELVASEPLRISVDDPRATVRLAAAAGPVSLTPEGDGVFSSTEAPLGVPLFVAIAADGPYRARVDGAGLVAKAEPATSYPLEAAWELPIDEVAAYWPQRQSIAADVILANEGPDALALSLDTATSHYLWTATTAEREVRLEPGETRRLSVTIEAAADAWAGEPVQLAFRARSTEGATASALVEVSGRAGATPVSPSQDWAVPDALLGGLNVASMALGSEPAGTVAPDFEPQLYDGITPDGAGFGTLARELPIELTIDLAGDEPILIAGTMLNPQGRDGRLSETIRDFELLLSTDGNTWTPALKGRLSPLPVDQAYVLAEPTPATQARLRILSRHSDRIGYLTLGEWKVLATPGVGVGAEPLDLADSLLGGHIVRLNPASLGQAAEASMLDRDLGRESINLRDTDSMFDLTVGFHEGRAAQVVALEWIDPVGSKPGQRLEQVDAFASRGSPFGPWEPLGTWRLARSESGEVTPLRFTEPVWARYVRLTGQVPEDARALELPGALRILERETSDDYRSILGSWGYTSAAGPFEWLEISRTGVAPRRALDDPSDQASGALPLAPGVAVAERVEIDADEDWYSLQVPLDDNTLELTVTGQPSVRTSLELYDDTGGRRPLAFSPQADGSVVYEAAVEPGSRYDLRVLQPPFSAVFTFDTSSSMGPFRDLVVQGMRTFAADVQPGREAVTIVPFEEPPLLTDWEDDAFVLQEAVNGHDFGGGSSGAEAGLIASADLLQEREGARAILLVTDAETSTHRFSGELWERLERVRPIVFSVHVGAQSRAVEARHLMQDWARSGGGHYAYPTTHGEMDRAFERMATWLRRPADYGLAYTTTNLSPSTLAIRAPADAQVSGLAPGVAVEIILDTSGSMNKKLAGRSRIEIARESLESLIGETLAEGVPVAVRTFGGKGKKAKARCQTRLLQPLEPLDRRAALDLLRDLRAGKKTKTPIAAALASVARDLAEATGPRSVVLVTDGAETCKGDPAAAIAAIRDAGIDLNLNIVGFALEDEELKASMAAWAEAGDGSYFDASGAEELARSLAAALRAPFRVYGPDGETFEGGTVGGSPIQIDPGTYRVEVLSDPIVEFDEVVIGGGRSVVLELPTMEDR